MKTLLSFFSSLMLIGSFATGQERSEHKIPTWDDKKIMMELLAVPAECRLKAAEIFSEIMPSWSASFYAARGLVPQTTVHKRLKRIVGILTSLERESPQCFEPVANSYAITSLYTLDGYGGPHLRTAVILAYLAREGKLKALSQRHRSSLGGLWQQKTSKDERYLLLGAHDCWTSTIYYDPYMSPKDAGASLVHELTHLLRDKFTSPSDLGLGIKQYILTDEALATMQAALNQSFIMNAIDRDYHGPQHRLQYDFTLFDRRGHMMSLTKDWMNTAGWQRNLLGDFLAFSLKDQKGFNHIQAILDLVAKGYFGGERIETAPLAKELRSKDSSFLDPLMASIAEESSRPFFNADSFQPQELREAFTPKSLVFVEKIRDGISSLRMRLTEPSTACSSFVQSFEHGELGNYLGQRIKNPGTKQGSHPSDNDMKPGNEGTKPGNEGVKPRNEGTKPEIPIKPCLRPLPKV